MTSHPKLIHLAAVLLVAHASLFADNRLIKEKSPYLLQHAHNPVDWYPWSQEAFDKARKENKPIFLSIGYSTCHWCHVMERESFENDAVAKLLNDGFICIKVDREERPDVDKTYMAFVQATTGGGGWPMTVFLTPDLKPFFGGTYFPPEDADGLPGLKRLLGRVHEKWAKDHEKIVESAEEMTKTIRDAVATQPKQGGVIGLNILTRGYEQYKVDYDEERGGFGTAPKFPRPVVLNFLLHYHQRTADPAALDMTLRTLQAMARGGMHDQLAGGFHRYSTDAQWFLPHFEKMLYDQAQLASVYLDACQITHEPLYANVAKDILDYVLRDMAGKDGEFYSAEDADSAADPARPKEKAEGAFYVWKSSEIEAIVGKEDAAIFAYAFGVEANGNVNRDPRGEFKGRNVLHAAHSAEDTAKHFNKENASVSELLSRAKVKLLAARNQRPRPHLDDKTLVAWNGLMISALARGGQILDDPKYLTAAVRAADFIRAKLYDPVSGRLKRRYRDGQADIDAFADDYAFFIQATIDLYESTLDIRWLKLAIDLQKKQDELFGDEAGGYFSTAGADKTLIYRMKDDGDYAEPAANSIAAFNLLRLAQMTDDKTLRAKAEKTLAFFSDQLKQSPTSFPQMLTAADFHLDKPTQIILAIPPGGAGAQEMLRELAKYYLPNRIVLAADGGDGQHFLAERVLLLKNFGPIDGKTTAFLCRNFACQLPTNELIAFREQLRIAAKSNFRK